MKIETLRIVLSLSVLSVVPILGCKDSGTTPFVNDQFRPDDEPRSVDKIMAQQTANAAREDGTLYAQHFTAGKLNSLGYAKLSKIAYGPGDTIDSAGKLVIYIDLKGDAYTQAQDSVMKVMSKAGYADDAYAVASGPNPNLGSPAEAGLNALAKQSGTAKANESDKMEAYGKGVGAGFGSTYGK